jgi:hypothetical protein
MPLLVVHAILVSRETIFWTMALNTVGDFFRWRPLCRLPSSVKVFIERVHHGIDHLPRNLGAALIFFFGSDLCAGCHRPLRNRCVAERSHRLNMDLLGERRDIVEPFRREFHSRIPPHHPVYHGLIAVILIVDNEVDEARADAQGTAKRAMSGVPLPGMSKHVVRQGCPGITDFLFQKAGVPQPGAIPSAFLLEVEAIGAPAGLKRIELYPRPWQGRRFSHLWGWRQRKAGAIPRYPSCQENSGCCHEIATRN